MSNPEEAFQLHLERSAVYFAAVEAANALPWFADPEKSKAVIDRLGLPEDISELDLRRALFMERYK